MTTPPNGPAAALALVLLAWTPPITAQCETELAPAALARGDAFGYALDLDSDRLAVGAAMHDAAGPDSGTVFVAERQGTTWVVTAQLLPPPGIAWFGRGVALSGDTLVVSAPASEPETLFVYEAWGGGWTLTDQITSDVNGLGLSLALDGDVLVAGSRIGSNQGVAEVYERSGGRFLSVAQLTLGPFLAQLFGASADVDGGRIVVGAPRDWFNAGQVQDGSVRVFDRLPGGWTEVAALGGPGFESGAELGTACAVDGDVVVAGAPLHEADGAFAAGAAVVHALGPGGWEVVQIIEGEGAGDRVGRGVALDDDVLAVTADGAGDGEVWIHAFDGTAWPRVATLAVPSGTDFDSVPIAAVLDGGLLALGDALDGTGRARVLAGVGDLDVWAPVPAALAGTTAPCLAPAGSLAAGTPVLLALQAAPASTNAFVVAGGVLGAPFKGGTMVPDPLLVVAAATDALGGLELSATWPAGVPPGALIAIQAWIPDVSGPVGFLATDGWVGETP